MKQSLLVGWSVFGFLAFTISSPVAQDQRPISVKELGSATTTASGQPIRLPSGDVRVSFSEYVIAPGAKLPVHKHPYPRFAYVVTGTLTVTLPDSGQSFTYTAGDMIAEVVDQWHFGINTGTTPIRLIVLDQVPGNAAATILKE